MNIAMISGHACIRVHKMTMPLVQDGYRVHLASKKIPPGFLHYYYSFSLCDNMSQYMDTISILAKSVDLFHCHNEPSWFVTAIKERCDKPVILDVHDSYLARFTPEEEENLITEEHGKKAFRYITEERDNFRLADGLVFPGQDFADLVVQEYSLDQPHLVLPSYLPRCFYQYKGVGHLGGLVYEGRVDLPNGDNPGQEYGFRYADYLDLAKECNEIGIDFHIYSTRKDEKFVKLYENVTILHHPHPYEDLIVALQAHDWGLIGNLVHTPEWEVAFPNKMFEYIAAGIPVVAINAAQGGRFIEENGFGITVSSMRELAERWGEHREIRKTLIKNRQKFTMENHIQNLKDLYKRFL